MEGALLYERGFPGVGEALEELDREAEPGEIGDLSRPLPRAYRVGDTVEGGVDLDDIEGLGEEREGMEIARRLAGVDEPLPVGVYPACDSHADVIEHPSPLLRPDYLVGETDILSLHDDGRVERVDRLEYHDALGFTVSLDILVAAYKADHGEIAA